MENGQSMNAAGTQDSLMNILDQRDLNNDVMARRMKNRERQRRYRARKRLEADMIKSSVLNQSTPPEVLQLNGNVNKSIARVHCKRDWKKDARRVTTSKYQEDTLHGFVKPHTLASESQTILPSESKAEAQALVEWESHSSLILVNCESNKTKLGRRDWKADARKKKS